MDYFGKTGPLARRLGTAYRQREQQQQLVDYICGLQRRDVIAINAPVAVGKNAALGVGILLSGHRGILSTNTLTLLDQLADEAREWAADFPGKKIVVVRGRRNYVCVAKLAELRKEHEAEVALGFRESERHKKRLNVLQHAAQHDLVAGGPEGVERLSQSSCPGRTKCSLSDDCRYYAARDRAAEADLVITSHAMVAASIDYAREVNGEREYWFGGAMSLWVADEGDQLLDLQDDCGISGHNLVTAMQDPKCTEDACAAIKVFASNLQLLLGHERSIELDQRQWQAFADRRLPALQACLAKWPVDGDGDESRGHAAVRNLASMLELMQGEKVRAGFAATRGSAGKAPKEHRAIAELSVQYRRIELGETLRKYVASFERVAIVSGSMALPSKAGPSFEFFQQRSRIELTATYAIKSPIDYDSNLRIVHAPIALKAPDRAAVFAQFCVNVAREAGVGLILCCSYATIRTVQEAFEAAGLPILAQQQDSRETVAALAAQVKAGASACIVGNKSTWVGLDIDSRYKRFVILEKVPMPSPSVDLVLSGYLMRDGAAGWNIYGARQAMKQAIQGIGRSCRREPDRCTVFLCDSRFEGDYAAAIPGGQVVSYREGIEWARSIELLAPAAQPQPEAAELPSAVADVDFSDLLASV